jgi:hypothetical protein
MSLISDELVSESLKEVKLFIKEWSDNNTWVEVALNDLLLLHLYY